MKSTAIFLGRIAYWLAWPAHYIYLRMSMRTRILLVHENKIMVVRNWISDGKWGLPGGGMHRHEPMTLAALRELREEVGVVVSVSQLRHIGQGMYREHGLQYPYQCFMVQMPGEVPIHKQWYEIADAQWIDIRELHAGNAQSDLLATLHTWLR